MMHRVVLQGHPFLVGFSVWGVLKLTFKFRLLGELWA